MEELKKDIVGFNVRVYGVCVQNGKMLTLREKYGNWDMVKLPGGGVEFGEGLVACLKRECKEELNIEIEVGDVLYAQENYVPSLMKDQKQIVIIYYWMNIVNPNSMKINDDHIQSINWLPINHECPFSLPVDKMMFDKLLKILK